MNIFGFEVKGREEREKEEQKYLLRIFPKGAQQKQDVTEALKNRCPSIDEKSLLLYYISIRDLMLSDDRPDFDEAVTALGGKKQMFKPTPEIKDLVKSVMMECGQ